MTDIKVPPFTDEQKKVIEATERIANGKLICDVDDDIDVLTNEDFLRTATTEQLAEWMVQFVDFCAAGCSHCAIEKICMDKKYKDLSPEQMVEVWLKQPHTKE